MYPMFDIQTPPVLLYYQTTRWQNTLGNTFKLHFLTFMLKSCCLPQDGIIGCFILLSNATFKSKYFKNYDVISMMEILGAYICEDFSSIFQGGVKVLITGPWQEDSSTYTCLFDQISVPASLIQPGVLRCYCPGNFTFIHTEVTDALIYPFQEVHIHFNVIIKRNVFNTQNKH